VAIRKVNAITGRAAQKHKKPAATGSCQPAGSTGPAATQGGRNGMRERNTFGALPIICASCGRIGWIVQYAQNVWFWLVLQVVRSSWQEQSLYGGPGWAAVTGAVIDNLCGRSHAVLSAQSCRPPG
jgi:hypothetical protein